MERTGVNRLKIIFTAAICLVIVYCLVIQSNNIAGIVKPFRHKFNVFNDDDDVPPSLSTISRTSKYFNISHRKDRTLTILQFNPPVWLPVKGWTDKCGNEHCTLTNDRANLQTASAIIFFLTSDPPLPKTPPITTQKRSADQVWIFCWDESPIHQGGARSTYKTEPWRNTVNWTMTYTYDSDVYYRYGITQKQTPPAKNYKEIFKRKTKMAAWVVSNCQTQSQRDKYVEKLKQHGLQIDIFGRCAGKMVDRDTIRSKIDLEYKFYLSFENSICKDYITEKFFEYFVHDVVLVVRGGGNYSSLLPNNSYINTAHFGSIKELANHLIEVGSSEEKYTEYMMNKDRFTTIDQRSRNMSYCQICEKLNNLEQNRRTYTDLVERVDSGTCNAPNDIK